MMKGDQTYSVNSKECKLLTEIQEGRLQDTKIMLFQNKQGKKFIRKQIKLTTKNTKLVENEIKLMNIMKRLENPNVAELLSEGQYKKQFDVKYKYLDLHYYENRNLRTYLLHNQIDYHLGLQLWSKILLGIRDVHASFIIHNDIKLENIFLDGQNNIYIGDFGISQQCLECSWSNNGTIGYQAPESYFNTVAHTNKADIWAFGIVTYELFSCINSSNSSVQCPFISPKHLLSKIQQAKTNQDKIKVYQQTIVQGLNFSNDIPPQLRKLVLRMIKWDPNQRINWLEMYESQQMKKLYYECPILAGLKCAYKQIETKRTHLLQKQSEFEYILSQVLPVMQNYASTLKSLDIKTATLQFLILRKLTLHNQCFKENYLISSIQKFRGFSNKIKAQSHTLKKWINQFLLRHDQQQLDSNKKILNKKYFQELWNDIGPKIFKNSKQFQRSKKYFHLEFL